jgi:hypothetical protein
MNQKLNRVKQILVALVLIAAVEGFSSCEKYSYTPPAVDPNTTWHFQTDIQPIFNSNCVSCHGGTQSPNLSAGKSYLALTKGSYVSAPAESSRLYKQMNSSSHISRSTETDRLKVLYWITQGALNN